MSGPTPIELLEDRIKFKFHAAKEHLKNLKVLETKGGLNKNPDTRVRCEIEIEDLLSHLIGAIDALLFRMNEKLNLKRDQTSYSDLLDALRLALKGSIIE